jgi:glycosyltransferase involved in cell wall biosynthesis
VDISLVIAGPVGWMAERGVVALDRPGVIRLGRVSDSALDALYRRAAVVATASVYEGFGLTVLEAIARGRPVVASHIPAHAELLGGAGALFPPGDVDALADALEGALEAPAVDARLAHERAGVFSPERTIAGHLAAYRLAAAA